MKNFGSILAFIALTAGVVSARAVPNEDSVQARAPYPYTNVGLNSREPKKGKDEGNNAVVGAAANATAPDAALATGAAGKAAKKGKGKKATGAVLTNPAAANSTAVGKAAKKGKGKKADGAVVVADPAAAANATVADPAAGKAAKGKGKKAAADPAVLDPAAAGAANATVADPAAGKAAKKGKGKDATPEQQAESKDATKLSDIVAGLTGIDLDAAELDSIGL